MKIVFINVPWMKYYSGEGDEEVAVPVCGYNFQNVNGYYYGFAEGMDTVAIENIEGVSPKDESVDGVTVVWTAYNHKNERKIIGWYKNATIYRHAQSELTLDSDRLVMTYSIKAPIEKAILLPVELRLMDAKDVEDTICFEKDVDTLKDVSMYIHNYAGDQMNYVFLEKDIDGKSILNFDEIDRYFEKADYFLCKDLYGKAIRCFNKAIEIAPEIVETYIFKTNVFLSLKMYNEALEALKIAEKIEPDHQSLNYCLGLTHGLLGNYEESLKYYNVYLANNKDDSAIADRAIVNYMLGDKEGAKRDVAKAIKMAPDTEFYVTLKNVLAV